MAKKDYSDALTGFLNTTPDTTKKTKPVGSVSDFLDKKTTTENGLKAGFTRSTLIVNKEHLNKLKTISFNDGVNLKDVLEVAHKMFIDAYEEKNGVVEVKKKGLKI